MKRFDRKKFDEYREYYTELYYHQLYGDDALRNEMLDRLTCDTLRYDFNDLILDRHREWGLLPDENKPQLTPIQIKLKRQLILNNLKRAGVKIDPKTGKRI